MIKKAPEIKMPEITVVVPAYNVASYIGKALESLMAQDFRDWEAVVVNDGSTDDTGRICKRYAGADRRIRVLTKRNGGLAAARNSALDMARGEWIVCLDGDDMLAPGALSELRRLRDFYDADVVQGGFVKFRDEDAIASWPLEENHPGLSSASLSLPEARVREVTGRQAVELSLFQRKGFHNSAWGTLWRRSLFDAERYTPGILYEDLDLFYRLVMPVEVFVHTSDPVYLYRENPASILHVFNRRRLDVLDVTRRIEERIAASYPSLLSAARDRRFAANFNMYRLMNHAPDRALYAEQLRATERHIRRHALRILFHPLTRLKNRLGALAALLLPSPLLRRL